MQVTRLTCSRPGTSSQSIQTEGTSGSRGCAAGGGRWRCSASIQSSQTGGWHSCKHFRWI